MVRTVTLSLLMLVSVVVMLPFASSTAHGIRQSSAAHQQRRYRRHSRAWWRRHRARMRLRRAAAQAHRAAPLGSVLANTTNGNVSMSLLTRMPAGWNNPRVGNNGEVRFQTEIKA